MHQSKRRYTFSEAAVLLGTDPRAVRALVRSGLLRPDVGRHPKIPSSDIDGFLAHRDDAPPTAGSASLLAHQAYARSASVEKRLDRLEILLSLDTHGVDSSEEAMAALLLEARDDARIVRTHAPTPRKLLSWAKKLYGLNEHHLGLLAQMGEAEPWAAFTGVGEALLEHAPGGVSVERETAARYLHASLAYFRNTATLYIRRTRGSGALRRPWLDEQMALLFPAPGPR